MSLKVPLCLQDLSNVECILNTTFLAHIWSPSWPSASRVPFAMGAAHKPEPGTGSKLAQWADMKP